LFIWCRCRTSREQPAGPKFTLHRTHLRTLKTDVSCPFNICDILKYVHQSTINENICNNPPCGCVNHKYYNTHIWHRSSGPRQYFLNPILDSDSTHNFTLSSACSKYFTLNVQSSLHVSSGDGDFCVFISLWTIFFKL
jgi:hypothetical protein